MVERDVLGSEVVYDPFAEATSRDPFAIYRELRARRPLYHNEERGFYALSRAGDVSRAFLDRETFISGRGTALTVIQSGVQLPPGTVVMEDDPAHAVHRKLLSRLFTPRQVSQLEDRTRRFCIELFEPLLGRDEFDLIRDLGRRVPTRVISMLIGIPEEDEESVRDRFEGQHADGTDRDWDALFGGEAFEAYIDWRVEHPSDDIMTQLLQTEYVDETGVRRHMTRQELLAYVNIVALAGNETARLLIGWMGKLLSDHPDQRRLLVHDPSLVSAAVEESLRMEPPSLSVGRYVVRDVELHGHLVPAGSAMALLVASANRDESAVADPDTFDVMRPPVPNLTFGFGPHFCLGAALARLEARIVFEELLARFPDYEVDVSRAQFRHTGAELRGWDSLPVVIPQ
jgi:cytochrome P450